KAANGLSPDYQHGPHHQQGATGGHDCAAQRLVKRCVDELHRASLAHDAEVLPNPVEHHDLVVDRIADQGQQRCQHGQIKVDAEQRKDPCRDNHVMEQADHCRHCKLGLEAQADVKHDHAQGHQQTHAATLGQLFTHAGTDKLEPVDANLQTTGMLKDIANVVTQHHQLAGHYILTHRTD